MLSLNRKVLTVFFLGLFTAIYMMLEPYWVDINEIHFVNNDIPASFVGKKIIFIADIHHGPFFSLTRVKNIVKKINNLNPDIVLLGGDYVHREKKYIGPVFTELGKIKSTIFFGGVLGNHDHWESKEKSILEMAKSKITHLDNSSYWVSLGKGRIKIGGVGDLWEDTQLLSKTVQDTQEKDFVLLVSHNPDYFQEIKDKRVDLVLSGHTHGGQVTFFGLYAPVLPIKNKQFWKGIYHNDFSTLLVTTGIGTITPPIRFFSRPEIVIITLQREKHY